VAAAAPGAGSPQTPNVNLISEMPPVRHQGERSTCVAHAALAAFEHAKTRRNQYEDMSEQFLYWSCKQGGRRNNPGTLLRIAVPLLERDGCCRETTWKYNPATILGDESQGPPPVEAQLEALAYRIPMYKELSARSVDEFKAELAEGRVVAFSVPVYPSWNDNLWVRYSGDIVLPVPGREKPIAGHAMCVVGFVDMPEKPEFGGGRFIVRNSWGEKWGAHCPYGAGHGTMTYSYISRECREAYSIPAF
jgi:C1A family cysteine protease